MAKDMTHAKIDPAQMIAVIVSNGVRDIEVDGVTIDERIEDHSDVALEKAVDDIGEAIAAKVLEFYKVTAKPY